MNLPPGATYDTNPELFRVSVSSPAPQNWLAAPLVILWIAIAVYAFVIAPKRPDDPTSESLIASAFAALIGIPLIASLLFSRFGRLTICSFGGKGYIRAHLGPLGTRKPFEWSALASVREVELRGRFSRSRAIELDLSRSRAHRRLYIGKGISDESRQFLLSVLETEINNDRRPRPLGLDA
ncbi:MAG: hypothetical protein ABI972_05325 [Acidobacteriota bacterium]